ncbi:MAG: sn-glycerol-3-phosphate ABC transporter ATP-binding protein UgpC [Planctomycetes bacterium]|nr:sn-glycerol-3-phosphate ABC transporter ATP-binding protein UgpC [Planctomycetota bacterium]
MAEVVIENVTKVYPGGVVAVKDANLTIEDEEFLVLVGPSGCGKSTTLRMIAGLEEITEGTIRIGPRVVNDVPPKDRDIAMVFQNYALYPHMTVYKNMAFGLKLRGYPRAEIEERVQEAARILGITDLLDRKPKALSGGQRQRVAVGRAIVRKPSAFLFDEPLSNLDAKLRVGMRAELAKLHHRLQTTTIYVTHDQVEAMTLGNRIVVLDGGTIHQVASPLDLYDYPNNMFVAGFIGTPPMNFITGSLAGESGKIYFIGEEIKVKLPQELGSRVGQYVGKDVVLGIRPESVMLRGHTDIKEDENVVSSKVNVVEPLGDDMNVYFTAGGSDFITKMDSHVQIRVDDVPEMIFDLNRAHIFDPESGVNVSLREPAQVA